jgi:hypothetical protein
MRPPALPRAAPGFRQAGRGRPGGMGAGPDQRAPPAAEGWPRPPRMQPGEARGLVPPRDALGQPAPRRGRPARAPVWTRVPLQPVRGSPRSPVAAPEGAEPRPEAPAGTPAVAPAPPGPLAPWVAVGSRRPQSPVPTCARSRGIRVAGAGSSRPGLCPPRRAAWPPRRGSCPGRRSSPRAWARAQRGPLAPRAPELAMRPPETMARASGEPVVRTVPPAPGRAPGRGRDRLSSSEARREPAPSE